MKKSNFFVIAFAILLSACNDQQPKGLSEADVVRMLDSVKTVAKEEAKNELKAEMEAQKVNTKYSSSYQHPSSSSASSPNEVSLSLSEKAYNAGYKDGKLFHTINLSFYTKDNEKYLKDKYMSRCKDYSSEGYFGEANYNNRELYEEYRKGFFKGYEDGNNAL